MRRATLITGVIFLVLGGAFAGYLVHEYNTPSQITVRPEHYLDDEFISALGPWTLYLSWSNMTANSSSTLVGPYTLYVTGSVPSSCEHVTDVLASGVGASGSLGIRVDGGTRWYAFACDSAGSVPGFHATLHGFGFSYYLVTGIGLASLGGALTALAFFQRSAPPMLASRVLPPVSPPPP